MERIDYFAGTGIDMSGLVSTLAKTTLAIQDGLRGEFGKATQLLEESYRNCLETSRVVGIELLARSTRDEVY